MKRTESSPECEPSCSTSERAGERRAETILQSLRSLQCTAAAECVAMNFLPSHLGQACVALQHDKAKRRSNLALRCDRSADSTAPLSPTGSRELQYLEVRALCCDK